MFCRVLSAIVRIMRGRIICAFCLATSLHHIDAEIQKFTSPPFSALFAQESIEAAGGYVIDSSSVVLLPRRVKIGGGEKSVACLSVHEFEPHMSLESRQWNTEVCYSQLVALCR